MVPPEFVSDDVFLQAAQHSNSTMAINAADFTFTLNIIVVIYFVLLPLYYAHIINSYINTSGRHGRSLVVGYHKYQGS